MNARGFFDYHAGSPPLAEVVEAVARTMRDLPGNPSSPHAEGRAARRALEEARDEVAAFLGAEPNQVHFTSGGCEAINWAIQGAVLAAAPPRIGILSGVLEHECVQAALDQMQRIGCTISRTRCDERGHYLWNQIEEPPELGLVSFQLANSETGVVQDLARVADWSHNRDVPLHVDAVQAAGRWEINCAALGADVLSVSAHKFGGPAGVGALVIAGIGNPAPLVSGGGQERGRRGGTENLPGIVGMGVAARLARETLAERMERLAERTAALWTRLVAGIADVVRNGDPVRCLPGGMNVRFPGCDGETLVLALDLAGLAVSAGPACSSGALELSRVLLEMGLGEDDVRASIRLAVAPETTDAMLDRLVGELRTAVERQRTAP